MIAKALPLLTALALAALLMQAGCDPADEPAAADPNAAPHAAANSAAAPAAPSSDPATPPRGDGDSAPPTPAAPANAAPPAGPTGTPAIVFDEPAHDFGRIPETESRSTQLGFVNNGDAPLEIESITTTCGCTAATLEQRRYEPGERGELTVTFEPSGPGEQRKYVNIVTNGEPQLVRLEILADVVSFIEIEPRMMELGDLEQGVPHHRTITLSSDERTFEIVSFSATSPFVTARLVDPEAESEGLPQRREIEVTVSPTAPWGQIVSFLDLTLRARPTPDAEPITHQAKVRMQGRVFGPIQAVDPETGRTTDPTLRFGAAIGEPVERSVVLVRTTGEPFRVISATADVTGLPGAQAQAIELDPARWKIVFSATASLRPQQHRGSVMVVTDVRGAEHIEIPVSGVIRPAVPIR